jgi:hypothetical protein
MMHFTIVGTIVLCLTATVSGSSLRERDLQELDPGMLGAMASSTKKTKSTKKNGCLFMEPKKAAALGYSVLAKYWEDVLHTDCSQVAMYKVLNDYLDQDVVFTFNGNVIATGREAVNAVVFQATEGLCENPDTYLSWFILNTTIDSVDKNVFTLVTNEVISTPADDSICASGYTYTFKVLDKKCNTAKATAIGFDESLTLSGLTSCS